MRAGRDLVRLPRPRGELKLSPTNVDRNRRTWHVPLERCLVSAPEKSRRHSGPLRILRDHVDLFVRAFFYRVHLRTYPALLESERAVGTDHLTNRNARKYRTKKRLPFVNQP